MVLLLAPVRAARASIVSLLCRRSSRTRSPKVAGKYSGRFKSPPRFIIFVCEDTTANKCSIVKSKTQIKAKNLKNRLEKCQFWDIVEKIRVFILLFSEGGRKAHFRIL